MKNVLITSGGTIVKIDDVRHIGNFSSGTFPAGIGEAALSKGWHVTFLYSKGSQVPFGSKKILSLDDAIKKDKDELLKLSKKLNSLEKKLVLLEYQTFDEYKSKLENLMSERDYEIVFLGAAVSDYGVEQTAGKISSTEDNLTMRLKKNPKIIKNLKMIAPKQFFQVGFKLLSGVSKVQLFETAYKACIENRSNLTIANDLSQIRKGQREVLVVTPEKGCIKLAEPNLGEKVFDFVVRRVEETHYKTVIKADRELAKKMDKDFLVFKKATQDLYKNGLLDEFYPGSHKYHGSVSLRLANGFLITARSSDKSKLADAEIVFISGMDEKKREVYGKSVEGVKPSMNALLSEKIFNLFPNTNIIIHTHQMVKGMPTTDFPYTPGTLEYSVGPLDLFKKSRTVNLANHGQVTIGSDIAETLNYVKKITSK